MALARRTRGRRSPPASARQLRIRALKFFAAALLFASVGPAAGLHAALLFGPLAIVCGVLAVRVNDRARRQTRQLRADRGSAG